MRLAVLAALMLAAAPARAADVAAGQAVFNRCKICHTVEADGRSTVGPNLHGIFGRKAGTLKDFAYSEAMRDSGVVWNDQSLSRYLRDPKSFIPGDRMAFPGIKDETQLADLLAYLHQATQ